MMGPGVRTKEAAGEGAEAWRGAGGEGGQSVWCPMVKSGRTGRAPLFICLARTHRELKPAPAAPRPGDGTSPSLLNE